MEHLLYYEKPSLESPTLLCSFAGWPDAAEGATHAMRYLVRRLGAQKFCEVDSEEFYDFTQVRPITEFDSQGQRQIRWPANAFFAWQGQPHHQDMVVLIGVEPNLRWRTFARVVIDVAQDLGVSRAVYVGALLDAVPHSREARVIGSTNDPELLSRMEHLGVRRSGYTGPTGIPTVLMEAFRQAAIPYMSLWGASPHYLQVAPNPKVSLGLLKKLEQVLGMHIDTERLESQGASFEMQVQQVVSRDQDISGYVKRLEQQYDEQAAREAGQPADMPDPKKLVQDLEDFLRHRRGQQGEGGAPPQQ